MKNCHKCLNTGIVLTHYPSGGGRIYPCGCQNNRQKAIKAQEKLEQKRKKLGIPS